MWKKKRGDCSPLPFSFETNQLPSVIPFYGEKLATTNSARPISDRRRAVSSSGAQREHA